MKTGQLVRKINFETFYSGSFVEQIVFTFPNPLHPEKKLFALFSDGTICNLEMLIEVSETN